VYAVQEGIHPFTRGFIAFTLAGSIFAAALLILFAGLAVWGAKWITVVFAWTASCIILFRMVYEVKEK
jgi:hypothetical protein